MTNNRLGNKYTTDQTTDVVNYGSLGVGSLLTGNHPINPSPPYGPSLPGGVNVAVFNNNPFAVTVLQQGGTGMVFVSPSLVETEAYPNDAKTFRLAPYWGVKFTGVNTSGWLWIPD